MVSSVAAGSWDRLFLRRFAKKLCQGNAKTRHDVAALQHVSHAQAGNSCRRVVDVDLAVLWKDHPHQLHAGPKVLVDLADEFLHLIRGTDNFDRKIDPSSLHHPPSFISISP